MKDSYDHVYSIFENHNFKLIVEDIIEALYKEDLQHKLWKGVFKRIW